MTQPNILTVPFAESAASQTIQEIPISRDPSDPIQKASWSTGFPAATMQPLATGGVPPMGQDFNGILKALSEHIVYQNKGGVYRWSADVVSAGGYDKGSVVQAADGIRSYVSLIDGNTEPLGGSNWLLISMPIATQAQARELTSSDTLITPQRLGAALFASAGIQAFNEPGVHIWTVPDVLKNGSKKAWVTVIGGGGGGSRRGQVEGDSSGAGAGGGGLSKAIVDLTGVSTVTITVGSKGLGSTVNNTAGEPGGTSSFGSYLSATGGGGGGGSGGGGDGGVGAGGYLNTTLGCGGSGIEFIRGSGGSTSTRASGSGGGPGGQGQYASFSAGSIPGRPALGPGGGGAGGVGVGNGGDGADGIVIIQW